MMSRIQSLLDEYAAIHRAMTAEVEPSMAEQNRMSLREAEIATALKPYGLLPTGQRLSEAG
jgi:hypothetical protein